MNHRSFLTRQLLLKQFDDWFLDLYLCILEVGKSEIWVFRSMASRRDIVPHSGIMPVSIRKVIQMLVAFVMVETAIVLHDWILFSSSSLFPHASSSLRFFESSSIFKKGYFEMVVDWVNRKLERNNESKFEFCRRRFRGQRLAIIQGREQTRGAVLQQCLFGCSYRYFCLVLVRLCGCISSDPGKPH